jgi:hypothetical protein
MANHDCGRVSKLAMQQNKIKNNPVFKVSAVLSSTHTPSQNMFKVIIIVSVYAAE